MDSAAWASHAHLLPELKSKLSFENLAPYRDVEGREMDWRDSPAGSRQSLLRFLAARKGDVAKAQEMFRKHLEWRQCVFPIRKEGKVAELLEDGRRFRKLGSNSCGVPVLLVDFLWGYFLTDEVCGIDALRATLRFMEDEIAIAEASGFRQAICVAFGGPPPMGFAMALASLLEANYPERLQRAVIYPVPRFVSLTVWALLWFLDESTRSKVRVESYEKDLLTAISFLAEELPEELSGGVDGAVARFKPDQARMNALIRNGILKDREIARQLQEALLVREAAEDAEDQDEEEALGWTSWLSPLSCCSQPLQRQRQGATRPMAPVAPAVDSGFKEEGLQPSFAGQKSRFWIIAVPLIALLIMIMLQRDSV